MKRTVGSQMIRVTVAATTGLLAASMAHAQWGGVTSTTSSVTIFGVADVGVELANSGKGTAKRVINGGAQGSRLGFRGAEDLGDGLSALFRLEMGINMDDGTLGQGGRAFGREATVGLSSRSLGTLLLGRAAHPQFANQWAVDAFYWMGGGALTTISRSGATTRQLLPVTTSARLDNAISYVSPDLDGLSFRAIAAPSEGSTTLGRAYGLSSRYAKGPIDVVAAWTRENAPTNGVGRLNAYVVGGSYDFKAAKVFIGLTAEDNNCTVCTGLPRVDGVAGSNSSKFKLMNVGVRVPFLDGLATGIAQFVRVQDRSEYAVNPGKRDANWLALGAEYNLSKRTLLYSALATINNRNGSLYALGSGAAQQPAGVVGAGNPRSTTATLGIRHYF